MHVYISEKIFYVYTVYEIYLYINYMNMNVNTCTYFLNIHCMCAYLYIHNYTKYTHIYILCKQKLSFWMRLIAINTLTALFLMYPYWSEL